MSENKQRQVVYENFMHLLVWDLSHENWKLQLKISYLSDVDTKKIEKKYEWGSGCVWNLNFA
jgi:hypothetical protein